MQELAFNQIAITLRHSLVQEWENNWVNIVFDEVSLIIQHFGTPITKYPLLTENPKRYAFSCRVITYARENTYIYPLQSKFCLWNHHQITHNSAVCLVLQYTYKFFFLGDSAALHPNPFHEQPYSRYKVLKNHKFTEWRQNYLEHSTVKCICTTYTLNTHPFAHILTRLVHKAYTTANYHKSRYTPSHFRDKILPKIANAKFKISYLFEQLW